MALAVTAFLTAAAGAVAAQEGLEHRRLELATEARKLSESGDPGRAEALIGEAYAIEAEICWNEGRLAAAEANWREAVSRGWGGQSPWQKEAEARAEGRQEGPQDPFDPTSVLAQERLDPLDRPDQPRLLGEVDIWPYAALAPYHRGGASTWHSLLGTPPFEEAVVLPRGARQARIWMDVVTADVLYDNGKGVTMWGGTLTRENFELNYSITDSLLIGGRLTAGEIIGEDPIRLFEGPRQIVPSGERG
jgi:hypothetical protein